MKPKFKIMKRAAQAVLLAMITIAFTLSASADVVADWNEISIQAVQTHASTGAAPARPGPVPALDTAVVHAAIYDAVQAIEKKYQPYYIDIPGATGSSIAAAAKAAHDVLVNRFPLQTAALDLTYQQYLLARGIPENDPGVAVGAQAAAGIIALRACDGSFPAVQEPVIGGMALGQWRPTTPGTSMAAPWMGKVTPFFMTRPSQFRAEPPPDLESQAYTRDYREVKALGAKFNSARTPEQTDIAHFQAGSHLAIWQRAAQSISNAHVDNIADSSRLFALLTMSAADAAITSWDNKSYHMFWRPITAIRLGDLDGNSKTVGDPTWDSLIPAPPYPDYTSGAVSLATGVTASLEHFFGTDAIAFQATTTNTGPTNQDTRSYSSFSQASDEVVDGRVYLGIHFRFADKAAQRNAQDIARFAFQNYLRPASGSGK